MELTAQPTLAPSARLVETVTRTLRHEVGDLLQTVYSAVAILQERIPVAQSLERRLLTDLRARAETCKHELDAVHDLVCPLPLTVAPLDLADLAGGLAETFRRRFASLVVRFESAGPRPARGDARKLAQVGSLLLLAACQAAQHEVVVRLAPVAGGVEWTIRHDGPAACDEQRSWLTAPFTTTHHALFGLGVALAARLAAAVGGSVHIDNPPAGGSQVRLVLPQAAASQG
jgi:signal transduction histidine kinase